MSLWQMMMSSFSKKEIADGKSLRAKADELTIEVDARITRRQKIKRENHLGANVKRAMGG